MSRDLWEGDQIRPLSMNGWNYVEGNPVNYVDPSGRCRGLTGKAFDLCVRAVTTAAKSWWWYDSNVNQGMYDYTRSGLLTGFEGVLWWEQNVNQGMYNYTRSGLLAGFEGVLWWEQNVNQPMLYRTREVLCEFLNPCRDKLIPFLSHGTFSSGVGVLGGAIMAVRGGVEVAFDNQGNIALLGGIGGGGTALAGGSIAPSFKVTNAPTVDKLKDWSAQLGGGFAKLTKAGGEVVFFRDE